MLAVDRSLEHGARCLLTLDLQYAPAFQGESLPYGTN